MSSIFGENLKLSIFGQSHGAAVGMTLDGIPAGLPVDIEALQEFLSRRSPGSTPGSTGRVESDRPEFLAGIVDGFTCGAPIAALIRNKDTHSEDYNNLKYCPRPGHADYTAHVKYGGFQDAAGGGHFSGRLTAALCIAGGLCKQWLEKMGIRIGAQILQIGTHTGESFNYSSPQLDCVDKFFPTLDPVDGETFRSLIETVSQLGDSVGGKIQCAVTGVPAGVGEPMFGGVESRIAQIIYSIPGVKALGFGWAENFACAWGSDSNDAFIMSETGVITETNHCAGILGGITNGMPIVFDVTFKPTASIRKPQQTVDLRTGEPVILEVKGRHDACIVPRAVPVVEAAAAIAVLDMILGNTQTKRRKA